MGKRKATAVLKRAKVHKVMDEFKARKLHSGSKKGPVVRNRKQAIAIALSEARRAAGGGGRGKQRRGRR